MKINNLLKIHIDAMSQRVINNLKDSVEIIDLHIKDEKTIISIKKSSEKAFRTVAEKCGWQYEIVAGYGATYYLAKSIKSYGFIIGSLFSIILIILCSQLTFGYVVIGEYNEQVNAVVKENAKLFTIINKEEMSKLKLQLDMLDGIANTNVYKSGSKLVIETKDELKLDETGSLGGQKQIYATTLGIVTRVIAFEGTPLVKKGDTVKVGDVLIDGYRQVNDELKIETQAKGEVFGNITMQDTQIISCQNVENKETGNRQTINFVGKFDKNKLATKIKYDNYYTKTTYYYLSDILPILVTSVEVIEIKQEVVNYDTEEYIKLFGNNMANELLIKSGKKGEVVSVAINTRKVDNNIFIDVFVTAEVRLDI